MSNDTSIAMNEGNEFLPEQSRREYLQAMGIVTWLPKDQTWQDSISKIESEHATESSPKNVVRSLPKSTSTTMPEPSNLVFATVQNVSDLPEKIQVVSETVDRYVYPAKNQFLKLVNWSHQSTISSQSKRLLVICRHKVDEPANSFARATAPSQFMLDYIKSLIELTRSKGTEIEVQLAHLSQIGFADGSLPFAEGLNQSKPDLVLILGDETITQFVPDTTNVSELRGKQIALSEQLSACVSYHPFTLIQDPSLKRLAFEDLRQLADFFNA